MEHGRINVGESGLLKLDIISTLGFCHLIPLSRTLRPSTLPRSVVEAGSPIGLNADLSAYSRGSGPFVGGRRDVEPQNLQ
jgi:hypothetical protein